MADALTVATYFEGTWQKGNVPIMRAADQGSWLGTTVFDGARYFDGLAPDLLAHCERVNRSAIAMGLVPTHTGQEIAALAREGFGLFDPGTALYVRPMYWGVAPGYFSIVPADEPAGFCICLEAIQMAAPDATTTLTRTMYHRPVLADAVVDAKAGCLYPNNARMLKEALDKGFGNALVNDALGNVAESASSNVFMVRDGEVHTPIANGTFLAGITRARAMDLLQHDGLRVTESVLTYDDFEAADEVFLTGNMNKVTPVTAFDDISYQHGPVARRLRDAYWDWAASA